MVARKLWRSRSAAAAASGAPDVAWALNSGGLAGTRWVLCVIAPGTVVQAAKHRESIGAMMR